MKITRLTLGLILLVCAQRAGAQTLSLSPASIGSITHDYSSDPEDGNFASDTQQLTFDVPSVQLINYDTVQVQVNAPAGEMYSVSAPAGISDPQLTFSLTYGGIFGAPYASVNLVSLQLDNLTGSPGTFNENSGLTLDGANFTLAQWYTGNGDLTFTGFTATLSYNNSSMGSNPLGNFYGSDLQYLYSPDSDPGQLMTLVPAPEPSTLALLGIGGLGLLPFLVRRHLARTA